MSSVANAATIMNARNLRFLLHEWLAVEELTERPRFADQSREEYDDVLGLAEQLATEQFAPHNRAADANEPRIAESGSVTLVPEVRTALQAFSTAGLLGAGMPEHVGGLGLPFVVTNAAFAWFQAANVGTAAYPMLTMGAVNLLLANGTPEQVERFVVPMVEGRFFGTMSLSETQAGSSLADIATRAERQSDGSYRLFGTKMWISGGDHELSENIVHLVLAKIPEGPAGVKGISLFIVPRFLVEDDGSLAERNDVVLAGLNHKMGYRGTVNTVLGFGEGVYRPGGRDGAVGYLVGDEHRGLEYMFHMMNEARIGVGLSAACLGYAGYLKALQYARERPQGRTAAAKSPTAPQVPIVQHADVRRMLLAQKAYAEGALALVLYASRLIDEQHSAEDDESRHRAALLLDVLTPIVKSWPSQWCLEGNSLAIQVHGGYGYAREYDVEQLYRDNRLNAIHEGTHGIQGLDLLGRKVTMHGGAGFGLLVEIMVKSVDRALEIGGEAAELGARLGEAVVRLVEVTEDAQRSGQRGVVLANASAYLEAAGHIVVAWMWLEQWVASEQSEGDFYDGKRQAARYFFRTELPKVGPQLDLLAQLDRTSLDMQDAWF